MIGNGRLTVDRRTERITRWRQRADQLDTYAHRLRSDGRVGEAADAEQAATEYRIATDDLGAGL